MTIFIVLSWSPDVPISFGVYLATPRLFEPSMLKVKSGRQKYIKDGEIICIRIKYLIGCMVNHKVHPE